MIESIDVLIRNLQQTFRLSEQTAAFIVMVLFLALFFSIFVIFYVVAQVFLILDIHHTYIQFSK